MAQKVLVVDDEKSILEIYQTKLVDSGYDVKVAENGKQALELAETFLPDVILLDLGLPVLAEDDIDGLQMLQKLRETTWGKGIKVIILTNTDRDKAPDLLANLNISLYIVKVDENREQVVKHVQEVLSST